MKKLAILSAVLMLFFCASVARADSIESLTTIGNVQINFGCWNPADCTSPELFWSSFGLGIPAVEPVFVANYTPEQVAAVDWVAWYDAMNVVATPEPATLALLSIGLLFLWKRK